MNILKKNILFDQIEDQSAFYFVHKYECITKDKNNLVANINYSKEIDSAINHKNIFGTQFHPEKSQVVGIKLLKTFRKLKPYEINNRILPVLFIKNGLIVRSEKFEKHQIIGNVLNQAKRLNDYEADELIYIDISRNDKYDLGRDDLSIKSQTDIVEIINEISKVCFMPLSFGGKIRSCKDAVIRIRAGADKIIINSILYDNVSEVKNIVKEVGSQAVVASIDYKQIEGNIICFKNFGKINTKIQLNDLIKKVEDLE